VPDLEGEQHEIHPPHHPPGDAEARKEGEDRAAWIQGRAAAPKPPAR
jgi:hypothetical protein